MAKLGWFKGRWIGDMPAGKGGKSLGVSTNSRAEANAMYDYLKSKGRRPKMYKARFRGGLRYYVYWRKMDFGRMPDNAVLVK